MANNSLRMSKREKEIIAEASKIYNGQSNKDKRVISQYESIPDYNILERTFNKDKKQQYETKQKLYADYAPAKTRQTEQFIKDNNISNKQLENLWVGNNGVYKKGSDVDKTIQLVNSLGGDYDALVKYYDDTVNKKAVKNVEEATSDNALSAIGMNALSALGNTTANAGYAVNSGLNYLAGKPIGDVPTLDMELNQAIRSTTKDMIDESTKGSTVGNKLANTAYDVGMGVADFGGALALGGGNPTMALGFQTASGVGGATYDAKQRGLTDAQALGEGAVAGGAELLLGQLPLDVLTKTNADDALLKTILKQGASEALEEGGTSAVNAIADTIIAGENSNYELKKQTYLSMGMSVEDAEKQALLDTLKEVGYEGLVGGLSGGVIGGINMGVNRIANRTTPTVSNELEPLAETIAETPVNESVSQNKVVETQQPTNTMPLNENALNGQIQSSNEAVVESAPTNNISYNTKTIEGFEDVSKEMNKLIGMYGNDSIRTMHSQVVSLMNEYMATNDISKFQQAMEIASEIDRQMLGNTYKYKATRKGTKGENARTVTTYEPDSYVETLYSEAGDYQTMANLNAPKNNISNVVPDLANADTVNPYASTENIQSDNQRVRSYNTTLTEKTDAPQVLKNEFIENPQIYTQLSNKATLDFAMDILNNNDLDTAISEYRKMLDVKNPTAIPLGYNISKQLVAEGRLDESVQVIRDMSKALTESGQFSQAAAITMMNNDPEVALRYLVREIDNLNMKGKEKFGKKWEDFKLTDSEISRFGNIEPGDTEAIKQAYQDVYNRLQKEYPSTFKEKLMEYRRVAMLLNVRTNIRNVVSNAMLFPVRWTADRVSALGEGVYSLINPEYQRTQSLNPIRSAQSRKLANEIFEANKDVLLGTNKYDDAGGAMRDKQVFKGTGLSKAVDTMFGGAITKANNAMGKDINPSLMETARNFTYYLLEKGDNRYVKKNFVSRLASYLDAQGITDIADVPPDAIQLATQEAMKATFKDDTKLSQTLSNIRQNFGIVGDIIMPFTKTPANLAMRGIDYSPVGVVNAVKTLRNATTNEEVAKGITQLGQSATGTAAIMLGYVLAELGWITGALSEDKDEAQFQKQQGMMPYSINTPLGYITYDWAQPASIPLILGATIYDSLKGDVSLASGLKQGGLAVADSWLELSPLQNLSDIFGGYGTPAENVLDVLTTDFPLSFVPSQLGAIARATDNTQRTSYSDNYWDNLRNQFMSKVPGLSEQLPATYDTWGNEVQRYDNLLEGVIANFVNPGQFGNASETPIDNEILDLYEATGNASVFPKKASWTENKQKLSAEEYSEFQRISGSNSYDMVESLIDSSYYRLLDDEQKADIISEIYNFSNALADKEITAYDIKDSSTYKKVYEVYEDMGAEGVAQYYAMQKLAGQNAKSEDYVNAVEEMRLSDKEKGYFLSVVNKPSSNNEKEQAKVDSISKKYGEEGLYNYYSIKSKVDTENGISAYDVISEYNLTEDEKGYYLKMLDSSTSDSSKQKISDIERAYGLDGLYDWYTIKDNTVKDTNAGKIMAIDEMDMSTADKGFYLSKYLNSLSKQAEEILANDGYEALYWYYYDKTEKDRQELQTRTDLLKSILYN